MAVTMAVNFAALIAILVTREHLVSARLFTAECHKNHFGAFLCAATTPDAEVDAPPGMTGHIGCTMSCTLDEQCQHFNYVPTAPNPCQLFYTQPTSFVVSPGCAHYRSQSTGARRSIHPFNAIRELRLCVG